LCKTKRPPFTDVWQDFAHKCKAFKKNFKNENGSGLAGFEQNCKGVMPRVARWFLFKPKLPI
jgi:hypothetical protein